MPRPWSAKTGAPVFWGSPFCLKNKQLKDAVAGVTWGTSSGDGLHWNSLVCLANFLWASDYAEGFISDVVITAELLHSSRTSGFVV